MVRPINEETLNLRGLSTDTKPTTSNGDDMTNRNGSTFYEIDTHKMYMYDEENDNWWDQGEE